MSEKTWGVKEPLEEESWVESKKEERSDKDISKAAQWKGRKFICKDNNTG